MLSEAPFSLCCPHASELRLFSRNNRRLTSGPDRQGAHDDGPAHRPSIVQQAFWEEVICWVMCVF